MTLRDFQEDFNKNLNRITSLLGELATQVADELPSPRAKQILNSALDLLRPHFLSLGLRIVKLNPHQIEILIPAKSRNLDEAGFIIESIVASAGIEAFKLLWKENAPKGQFENKIHEFDFTKLCDLKGDVRVRVELSDISREAALAELHKNKHSRVEVLIHCFNFEEQICAELNLQADLYLKEMIDWK